MASFTVEEFSLDTTEHLTREDIDERYTSFKHLTHLKIVGAQECGAHIFPHDEWYSMGG